MAESNPNKVLKYALVASVVFGVVMAGMNVNEREFSEGIRLENERILRDSKKAVKRFESEAQAEREARKAIEAENLTLQTRNRKSDSTASYWQKQFIHEKNRRPIHYSDAGYDSAINRLYPN